MNKRFFALLISTILMVLLTVLSPASESAKPLYGDANRDGAVNCVDATYIQRYLVNLMDIDEDTLPYVIVSGKDKLSIIDAFLIQRFDAMLISEFPIESMQSDIVPAHNPTEAIPEYVRTEAARVSQTVKAHQSADSFSFLAISDMHYREDYINIKNGITHAGMGMELIRNSVPIDAGAVLGDNGWQSQEETLEEGLEQIKTANRLIDNSLRGIPTSERREIIAARSIPIANTGIITATPIFIHSTAHTTPEQCLMRITADADTVTAISMIKSFV